MPKRKGKQAADSPAKKAKAEDKQPEAQDAPAESDESLRSKIRENRGAGFPDGLTIKFRPSKPHKAVKGLNFPVQMEYFTLQALAEIPRLLLEEAQVPYDFLTRSGDAFAEERAKSTPFGAVPVVRLKHEVFPFTNGVLAQSHSITRFFAQKLGFDGKSAEDRAYLDMIYEASKDIQEYLQHVHATDKKTYEYKKMARLLQMTEGLLEKAGGEFFGGSTKPTYADIAMFHVLTLYETSKPGCLRELKVDKLAAFREAMAARPNIAAYLSSARRIPPVWKELRLPGWESKSFGGYEFYLPEEKEKAKDGEAAAAKPAAAAKAEPAKDGEKSESSGGSGGGAKAKAS